jgi:hypothetical protein
MYPLVTQLASRRSLLPQDKYKPRNRVPWIVCIMAFVVCMVLLLIIRRYLVAENKRRDAEPPSHNYDDVYIERLSPDGKMEKVKIDKASFSGRATSV